LVVVSDNTARDINAEAAIFQCNPTALEGFDGTGITRLEVFALARVALVDDAVAGEVRGAASGIAVAGVESETAAWLRDTLVDVRVPHAAI
jgi:hypothetical protein